MVIIFCARSSDVYTVSYNVRLTQVRANANYWQQDIQVSVSVFHCSKGATIRYL